MPKSRRFQSGREIFEEYIPDYVANDATVEIGQGPADKIVDAILCDFYTRVPEPIKSKEHRSPRQ